MFFIWNFHIQSRILCAFWVQALYIWARLIQDKLPIWWNLPCHALCIAQTHLWWQLPHKPAASCSSRYCFGYATSCPSTSAQAKARVVVNYCSFLLVFRTIASKWTFVRNLLALNLLIGYLHARLAMQDQASTQTKYCKPHLHACRAYVPLVCKNTTLNISNKKKLLYFDKIFIKNWVIFDNSTGYTCNYMSLNF